MEEATAQQTVKHRVQLWKKTTDDGGIFYTGSKPQGLGEFQESQNPDTGYMDRSYTKIYWINVVAKSATVLELSVVNSTDKAEKYTVTLEKEQKESSNGAKYFTFEIQKGTDGKRRPVGIAERKYWITLSAFKPKNGKPLTETSPKFTLVFTEAGDNSGGTGFTGSQFDISVDDIEHFGATTEVSASLADLV